MDVQLGLFAEEPAAPTRASVGPVSPPEGVTALASRLPTHVRLGTSSWTFPGWEGLVYDRMVSQDVLAREGLAAYASHPLLRCVCIDRTYYRPVTAEQFRAYAAAVPDDFRFVVKADRLLTSPIDPDGRGVRARNPYFLDPSYAAEEVVGPMADGLGAKGGVLLFQFPPIPPNLVGGRSAFLERVQRFLSALPHGRLYAIELRTPAFLTPDYAGILETTGAAHCYSVHPAMAPMERQLTVVQPFYQPALVIRWMLHSGFQYETARERYKPFDRIVDADPVSRELIARTVLDVTLAERPSFVVANNKAEGSAPLTLMRLAERIGDWSPPLAS